MNKIREKLSNQDFWFKFMWKKVYILKEKSTISQILSQKENELVYINHNFNIILNHKHTINCYDSSTIEWGILHKNLKKSLPSIDKMRDLLRKHKMVLISKFPEIFVVRERLEDYLLRVWSEFMYGDDVDYYSYIKCRNEICKYLKLNFHESYLIKIPIIGTIYSYYVQKKNMKQLRNIYDMIANLNEISYRNKKGFVYDFMLEMRKQHTINSDKSVIENTLLLYLVVDFIHKVILDYLLRTSLLINKQCSFKASDIFQKSLSKGFLYPYRYRWIKKEIHNESFNFNINDLVIFDLKESALHFSSGPRTCIGQGLTRSAFYEFFTEEIINKNYIKMDNNNLIDISYEDEDANVPEIKWPYQGKWLSIEKSKEQILSKIKSYDGHNGVKYMNILSLYHDPETFVQIVEDLCINIKNTVPKANCLVVVETRGLSLGGAIATNLRLPLYTIRKKGKLPGEVHRQEYKMSYDEGVLELSKDDDLNNANVILIDDGIASGGTSYACIKLIEKAGGNVVKIVTMVNHTYKDRDPLFTPYNDLVYSFMTIPKVTDV